MSATADSLKGQSAQALDARAAQGIKPPQRLSVAAYAQAHRYLPGGSGRGDRWRNEKTPYLVRPMEVLTSGLYDTAAIVGPGQTGKTVVGENWLLRSVALEPAKMLWYMQSDDALEAYVKDRINPMIDDHDIMQARKGPRPIDDSLHYKKFTGMSVQFLTASDGNLINKSAPNIVADEIDAWGVPGDVKPRLDVRRQAFVEQGVASMILAMSHPDRALGHDPRTDWNSGIMAIFSDSTRELWYWECPICGGVSSPCPTAPRLMSLEYATEGSLDEVEESAHLLCPVNACRIKEHKRSAMNRTGVYIGEGQEISKAGKITGQLVQRKTAGFWIVGAMSTFTLGGIGGLARARVKAQRESEQTGEDDALREVVVKRWGFCYSKERAVGSISADDLVKRAEPDLQRGNVPEGVRFITIAVDANLTWFEWLVRGWGVNGESWIIDHGKVLAECATSESDWDMLLDIFDKAWPLADGSGRAMKARACGFDSAGRPGVTAQAYSAFTRWRRKKKISLFGTIGGREAWSIIPLKGNSGRNAAKLQVSYPDTSRKANKAAGRGEVPVGLFNPNLFKDDLAGHLLKGMDGPWYIHFPTFLLSKQPPHTFFEQAVSEGRKANGAWEKLNPNARNEALDLLVSSHVLAHLHGLSRINWDRPPPWARAWDENSLVVRLAPDPKKPPPAEKQKGGAVKVTIDQAGKKTIGKRLA
jgi:phage terminase large subunit GpA-like protein